MKKLQTIPVEERQLSVNDPLVSFTFPDVTSYGMRADRFLIVRNQCAELYRSSYHVTKRSKLLLLANCVILAILFGGSIAFISPVVGVSEEFASGKFTILGAAFLMLSFLTVVMAVVVLVEVELIRRKMNRNLTRIIEYLEDVNMAHEFIKFEYDVSDNEIMKVTFYREIEVEDTWLIGDYENQALNIELE